MKKKDLKVVKAKRKAEKKLVKLVDACCDLAAVALHKLIGDLSVCKFVHIINMYNYMQLQAT